MSLPLPYYAKDGITIYCGDCLDILKTLPADSVHAVVTDPPYGLRFMGKRWDYDVPTVAAWAECLRVLKPGGHLLAFAGTRTQHRMACNIEDAGFEIRDMIAWVYGSGFPKSLDIGKELEAWQGWGTALKPALEPITVARKPLEGTVAENVLQHGTGAINVGGCRVGTSGEGTSCGNRDASGQCLGHPDRRGTAYGLTVHGPETSGGRWPANLIHDGSEEAVQGFPQTTSGSIQPHHKRRTTKTKNAYGERAAPPETTAGDTGSAARFFYCAKASRSEREAGLGHVDPVTGAEACDRKEGTAGLDSPRAGAGLTASTVKNNHPTVKPLALMRYLVKLVTPPGGVVLDPFVGSGTTLVAARNQSFQAIGIDREDRSCQIARRRLQGVLL